MRGFTLIEIIIYIALLGALMTGALTSAVTLIQSSASSNGKATVQEEGSFVQRKLQWALSGLTATPTVGNNNGGNACWQTLSVTKTGVVNPLRFRHSVSTSSVEVSEDNGTTYYPLTTENVSVSCVKFAVTPANGSVPAGVTATVTIGGLDFVVTKYLRQ
jgi:prepilin-type N-terminal cleavage/methylation domain-containing protein